MNTKANISLPEIISKYEEGETISAFRMRVGKQYYIYGMTNMDFYKEFVKYGYRIKYGSTCSAGSIVLSIPNANK